MEVVTRFEYGTLDAETRIVVQQKTGEIRERIKRTANDIIEIGERLIDIKGRLGHGRFMDWLRLEFEWSDRTAQNLMGVADAFKSANFADLSFAPSALYALAAPSVPEEARREAIAFSEDGHHVTHAEAKRIIAETAGKSPTPALDAVRSEAGRVVTSAFVVQSTPPTPLFAHAVVPVDAGEDAEPSDPDEEPHPDAKPPTITEGVREKAIAMLAGMPVVLGSGVTVNLGTGPAAAPAEGEVVPTAGWERMFGSLNNIHVSVKEQGGIAGSVQGWSDANRRRLLQQLEFFQGHLDGWIEHLRRDL